MSILQGVDKLQAASAAQAAFPDLSTQSPTDPNSPPRVESPLESPVESRVRIIFAVSLIVVGTVCLAARLLYPFDFISDESHGWFLDRLLPRLRRAVGTWSLEMMLFYPLGILGIFVLERFFPAVPTQKMLSTGVVYDALWVLVKAAARLIFVAAYGQLLYRMYVGNLGFLTLPVGPALPMPARVALAILISDLLQFIQHWLHHNVKWLWPFHAIHHSQRELNLFSESRLHSMEYLVRRPLTMFPMLILGLEAPEVIWWLLLVSWHARLQHANIRTNFGPLRYLIVTPQSHRVHHSRRAEHLNQNYGSMLSIWDYLFGTQCRQYDVYPETGIDDEEFPAESARSIRGVLYTVVRQFVYPFRRIWMLCRAGRLEESHANAAE